MAVNTFEVLASAARTSTFTTATTTLALQRDTEIGPPRNGLVFQLDVTAVSGTTPTLDVVIETSIDGGNNWIPVAVFAQKTATALAWIKLVSSGAADEFTAAPSAGQTNDVIGPIVRAVCTIGGTTPSFTFAIEAAAM